MAGDDEDIRAAIEREGDKILNPINEGDQFDFEVGMGTMTEEQAKKARAKAARERVDSDEPKGSRQRWRDPYNPDASDA
ncbi:hypothetical protein [Streptomyces noursei]|uniref:hypothetical protein n=1 Tax=Streptomyces noursei TaxID=1971 RepID=UPI0005CAD781|nr:hypothetical protein [Streptomyces noursei]